MPDPSGKSGKTIGIVIAVLVVAGLIYAFSRGGEDGAAPYEDTSSSGGGGGGSDAILASCTPGTFSGTSDRLSIDVTVNGKKEGVACGITASVAVSQGAGFFDGYDKNKDGKLSMDCSVPLGTKSFAALTEWLKGPGINGCEGEYKDLLGSLGE